MRQFQSSVIPALLIALFLSSFNFSSREQKQVSIFLVTIFIKVSINFMAH